jgi:NADPH:quinone reductase-like Zn-dependent oxidoreductase
LICPQAPSGQRRLANSGIIPHGLGLISIRAETSFTYGAMAQRAVVPSAFCFPVPDALDDATAAALPNPGVSALLSLSQCAKLAKGEKVLIQGATGVTGTLAVQIATRLGAGRVIASGRNPQAPEKLRGLGASAFHCRLTNQFL